MSRSAGQILVGLVFSLNAGWVASARSRSPVGLSGRGDRFELDSRQRGLRSQ